jgi:hypothetical protein
VYKKLIKPKMDKLPKSLEDGLGMMCENKKTAYFGGNPAMLLTQRKKNCSILAIEKASYPIPTSFAISKKSSYKRIFNAKYVNVREVDERLTVLVLLSWNCSICNQCPKLRFIA